MAQSYQALEQNDQELFQRHSTSIEQAVREAFPSIPADFQLEPVTIRKIKGCGMFYDFMIRIPDGKFAKVSFHTGGYPLPRAPGEKPPEPRFKVEPTANASEYE